MRSPALLVCTLLLSGCAGLDRAQSMLELSEGTRLDLTTALTVPPNTARVPIGTNGSALSAATRYAPSCVVEVEQPKAHPQTIMPGAFRVMRTFQHEDHMSCGNHIFATTMYLESETQPFVRGVTCEIWDGYATGDFLTAQQIEQTLSSVFKVR